MEWLQWIVVAALVAVSATYSVWRLLPRRRGGAGGCKSCPASTRTGPK